MRALLTALVLAGVLIGVGIVWADSCGYPPLKPLIPVGCKDIVLVCQCDEHVRNCHWAWICIPA